MRTTWLVVLAIAGLLLIFSGCVFSFRNNAVMFEENVKTANSGIDAQLTTRYNKLLELAQCVKRYDEHEYKTLTQTISERGKNATEAEVKSAMASISAVAERYPELQAQKNYAKMMDEVSLMENSVSQHRHAYNEAVREYTRFVNKVPVCWILSFSKYEVKKFEYYTAPLEASDNKPLNLF